MVFPCQLSVGFFYLLGGGRLTHTEYGVIVFEVHQDPHHWLFCWAYARLLTTIFDEIGEITRGRSFVLEVGQAFGAEIRPK
jgi:hypothetical protein